MEIYLQSSSYWKNKKIIPNVPSEIFIYKHRIYIIQKWIKNSSPPRMINSKNKKLLKPIRNVSVAQNHQYSYVNRKHYWNYLPWSLLVVSLARSTTNISQKSSEISSPNMICTTAFHGKQFRSKNPSIN